jgi:hypothetical protein
LTIFAICIVLITAYLLKYDQKLLASRIKAGPTAETQKSQQVIQSLASLFYRPVHRCWFGLSVSLVEFIVGREFDR